jgi:LytR cell envelope-related transcriptional attenuator
MDHPAQLTTVRPWRSAALITGAIATVELVLLVVAAFIIFAEPFADGVEKVAAETVAKATAPPAAPAANASGGRTTKPVDVAEIPRRQTSVMVLNGNGRTGAASEAASVVQALHYLIAGTADAPRTDFSRSLIMFRPGFRGEAERLADDVRIKRVTPLDGMKSNDLGGAHVVLIVGQS